MSKKRWTPPPNNGDDLLPLLMADDVAEMLADLETDMLRAIAERVRKRQHLPDYMVATVQDMAHLRAALSAELGKQWQPIINRVQEVLEVAQQAGYDNATATLPPTVQGAPAPVVAHATAPARVAAFMAISQDTLRAFHTMPALVLRSAEDAYKRIMKAPVVSVVAGTHTVRQATQKALAEYARQGIGGFMDKSGRTWTMGAYTEMAVRTGAHRAMRHGHATALTDANIDLVTVRGSGYTCDLCAPWVGKVLSLTGKTPTGKQRLQHALHDGVTVEVDVAGTVEQARDAGLFHPNCGHNYAAFFPGLTTLDEPREDDGTYAASQRQRKLEREIRVLKRELAVTNQKTDVQRLRAGVSARQKQIRQLQQQYPALTRKYHREHPNFDLPIKHHQLGQRIATQPKTVTAPVETLKHTPLENLKGEVYMNIRESLSLFKHQQVTPELVERVRRLTLIKSDLSSLKDSHGHWIPDQILDPEEVKFLERFEKLGHRVKWVARDRVNFKSTNDFIWLNTSQEACELKCTGAEYGTIKKRIQTTVKRAEAHGVVKDVFIIDIQKAALKDKVKRQLSQYNMRVQYGQIRRLFVMSENGAKFIEIDLK